MEKDKDDRVSANEFLHIWDECHDIITDNIQICDARIKLATESKEKLVRIELLRTSKLRRKDRLEDSNRASLL